MIKRRRPIWDLGSSFFNNLASWAFNWEGVRDGGGSEGRWCEGRAGNRYPVSKLLQLFAVHEMVERTSGKEPFMITNTVNPGLCYTDLTRSAEGSTYVGMKILRALLAWTAEEVSRTLVHAVTTGKEPHGVFPIMFQS